MYIKIDCACIGVIFDSTLVLLIILLTLDGVGLTAELIRYVVRWRGLTSDDANLFLAFLGYFLLKIFPKAFFDTNTVFFKIISPRYHWPKKLIKLMPIKNFNIYQKLSNFIQIFRRYSRMWAMVHWFTGKMWTW